MASSKSRKGLPKQQTLHEPKFMQFDNVVSAMRSRGKSMIGPMITEEAKMFYDEMKITDKCTF